MDPKKEKQKGGGGVRLNVYLPPEAYVNLEKLQKLTGKRSLAETIRAALKLYLVIQEEIDEGKDLIFEDKEGEVREKLKLLAL